MPILYIILYYTLHISIKSLLSLVLFICHRTSCSYLIIILKCITLEINTKRRLKNMMLFSLSAAGRRSYQFKIMMLFSLESYQFKNHNNKLNMVLSSQKKIKYADETYFCMCMNMSIVVVYHYVTRVYFKDSNFQLMIIYLIL